MYVCHVRAYCIPAVHVVYRKELRGLGRCILGARERICERPEYM